MRIYVRPASVRKIQLMHAMTLRRGGLQKSTAQSYVCRSECVPETTNSIPMEGSIETRWKRQKMRLWKIYNPLPSTSLFPPRTSVRLSKTPMAPMDVCSALATELTTPSRWSGEFGVCCNYKTLHPPTMTACACVCSIKTAPKMSMRRAKGEMDLNRLDATFMRHFMCVWLRIYSTSTLLHFSPSNFHIDLLQRPKVTTLLAMTFRFCCPRDVQSLPSLAPWLRVFESPKNPPALDLWRSEGRDSKWRIQF